MAISRTSYDTVILAGDIGGTNVNLALVGKKGGTFTMVFDRHYKTREEASLSAPLGRFLDEARLLHPGLKPEICCVSGAGPVVEGRIALTNAPWSIEAREIESGFGIRTILINDFTAISYGVLLLDHSDPEQVLRLPRPDGVMPEPSGPVRLVVGAGTGLGVGYVVKMRDRTEAFPSEGGHITLPVFDEETRDFQRWLEARCGFVPGAEAGISGRGIANLLAFAAQAAGRRGQAIGPGARTALEAPDADRPALVAALAGEDALCAHVMDVFVRLYARVAADLVAAFLPLGGLYLAGGIAAKNEARFTEGCRFMSMFEKSYSGHIREILARTPVMIARDYSISLYGAANAAVALA